MATQTTSQPSARNSRQEESSNAMSSQEAMQPLEDLVGYARNYARQQPEMAALWCLGFGFILGWKLRPW